MEGLAGLEGRRLVAADIDMGVRRDLYVNVTVDVEQLVEGVERLQLELAGFPLFLIEYILDGRGEWFVDGRRIDRFPRRDEFRVCEWRWRISKSDSG